VIQKSLTKASNPPGSTYHYLQDHLKPGFTEKTFFVTLPRIARLIQPENTRDLRISKFDHPGE
jgi:hypothetical protein